MGPYHPGGRKRRSDEHNSNGLDAAKKRKDGDIAHIDDGWRRNVFYLGLTGIVRRVWGFFGFGGGNESLSVTVSTDGNDGNDMERRRTRRDVEIVHDSRVQAEVVRLDDDDDVIEIKNPSAVNKPRTDWSTFGAKGSIAQPFPSTFRYKYSSDRASFGGVSSNRMPSDNMWTSSTQSGTMSRGGMSSDKTQSGRAPVSFSTKASLAVMTSSRTPAETATSSSSAASAPIWLPTPAEMSAEMASSSSSQASKPRIVLKRLRDRQLRAQKDKPKSKLFSKVSSTWDFLEPRQAQATLTKKVLDRIEAVKSCVRMADREKYMNMVSQFEARVEGKSRLSPTSSSFHSNPAITRSKFDATALKASIAKSLESNDRAKPEVITLDDDDEKEKEDDDDVKVVAEVRSPTKNRSDLSKMSVAERVARRRTVAVLDHRDEVVRVGSDANVNGTKTRNRDVGTRKNFYADLFGAKKEDEDGGAQSSSANAPFVSRSRQRQAQISTESPKSDSGADILNTGMLELNIGDDDDQVVIVLDDSDEEGLEPDLPEITHSMEVVIAKALSMPESAVITDGFGITIRGGDIQLLEGLHWLNDEIINFYFALIQERSQASGGKLPKVYCFNTFFYPRLLEHGHAALKRWTKKVDLFTFDLLLIPVHLGMHWCLAVVDFRSATIIKTLASGKKPRSPSASPPSVSASKSPPSTSGGSITYFDSLGGTNIRALKAIQKYLHDEHTDKKKDCAFDASRLTLITAEGIPQQLNGSDCGVFACKFAEFLARDAAITFSQETMPFFRKAMVFEVAKRRLLVD